MELANRLALCQGYVRGYIVGEFDNLNFQALLFSQLFNVVHDFSVRTGGYTDFNRCVRVSLFIGCLVVTTAPAAMMVSAQSATVSKSLVIFFISCSSLK